MMTKIDYLVHEDERYSYIILLVLRQVETVMIIHLFSHKMHYFISQASYNFPKEV